MLIEPLEYQRMSTVERKRLLVEARKSQPGLQIGTLENPHKTVLVWIDDNMEIYHPSFPGNDMLAIWRNVEKPMDCKIMKENIEVYMSSRFGKNFIYGLTYDDIANPDIIRISFA